MLEYDLGVTSERVKRKKRCIPKNRSDLAPSVRQSAWSDKGNQYRTSIFKKKFFGGTEVTRSRRADRITPLLGIYVLSRTS